jgi:hypothetical protein
VTLTSMTMSAPVTTATVPGVVATPPPTGGATSQGFTIAGTAFSYDSVARLLSRLALVPDLSNVTLTSTGSDGGTAGASSSAASSSGVTFNISAAVKGAPAPPPTTTAAPVAPVDTSATTTAASS